MLLVCCLSVMASGVGGKAEAAPQQITMSLEQWNSFKERTNQLEANLNLLDEKLQTQKGTSKELLTQLAEAKKQLKETQTALMNSKKSLANVEKSLKISESLYKKLNEQIGLERRKNRRVKHQRNIYAGCAVFAIAYAAAK